ncbi:MAG TPA: histidine phosphatase family protein [Pyrinomonadaceae bacterium]
MKTLFVLRHAKSSWDDPDLSDLDRPLNHRGKVAAPFMGDLMARNGFLPDVILSSPAIRARETARLVKEGGDLPGDITEVEEIYEAIPKTLRRIVSGIDDRFRSAMIVGHNPGMEGFVRLLTGKLKPMPTAALAVIELDIATWSEIADGSGKLHHLIRPKDEMKAMEKRR